MVYKSSIHQPASASVSSLNGLTGAVTLAAGTNVTITPAGNTLTIASSGGGSPGGTNGQIQYNNSGTFGGLTYVPTSDGGSGASNEITYNSSFGTINNFVAATNIIAFTTNNSNEITGMVAPSPAYARQVTIVNDFSSNGNIQIDNESTSSTAANRFDFSVGYQSYYEIPYKGSATFVYSPTDARWKLLNVPQYVNSNGLDGILGSSDYSYFSAKQDKVTGLGGVAFSNGSALINDPSQFYWDDTNYYLGLGLSGTLPAAGIEIGSPTPFTLSGVSSGTGAPVNISNAYATPSGFSAVQDNGGSGYTANGSTYDYNLYVYNFAGGSYFGSPTPANVMPTDDGSSNPFQWDLSWSGGIFGIDGFIIQNANAGITELVSGGSGATSFVDNNDMVNNAPVPINASSASYVANGSTLTRSYFIYAYKYIGGVQIYSSSGFEIDVTDPGDSSFYVIALSWGAVTGASGYKIIRTGDATGAYDVGNVTQITDNATQGWGDSSTVTPTSSAVPALLAHGDIETTGNIVTLGGNIGTGTGGANINLENNLYVGSRLLAGTNSDVFIPATGAVFLDTSGDIHLPSVVYDYTGSHGSSGQIATNNGTGFVWANPATGGTVTSVALTLPGMFNLSGSPVTTAGTFAVTLANEPANLIFAGPSSGSSAPPLFRSLVTADVPALNQNTTGSAAKWTTARLLAGNSTDGSANVPFANKFIVQGTSDTGLTGAQFMGALGTGLVKNTTTTGVQSIAAAGTDYLAPFGSQTANFFYAAPNGTAGTPTFRAIVAADIPTLNQSTTGNAATVTTNANLTGPITSIGNATTITNSVALPGSPTTTTQTPGDNSTKVATTAYVAAALLGQDFKEACKYASTAALPSIVYANGSSGVGATLTGVALAAISLDSSSPSVNDRVLIKNQVSTFQNGIYIVTATGSGVAVFVLTRSTDFNQSSEIDTGDTVFVTAGATQATTTWAYNAGDQPVIGTDPITFAQTAGQGSFTAGNGIAITGTSIAIDTSVTVDKNSSQTLTNKTLTSPVLTAPALGTPASGVATNLTGTASGLTAGTVSTIAGLVNGDGTTITRTGSGTSGSPYILSAVSSGVTSIAGTANEIIASASTGAITLSTPQAIATTSNVSFASVAYGAGTTTQAPIVLTSGTNLITATAGAEEYDGTSFYETIDTTSGRGVTCNQQIFKLPSTGSLITTIANYFGTNSNISLVSGATYEIEIECWYLKTTAGTVTWTFTNSAAPTAMNILYAFSPIGGIVSVQAASTLFGQQYNITATAPTIVTGSLSSAANHYNKFKIILFNGTGTSLKIQATCSAGSITPGIGSRWRCQRLPAGNTGTFAA